MRVPMMLAIALSACGRIAFDPIGDDGTGGDGGTTPCRSDDSPHSVYRSIGTSTTVRANKASVRQSTCAVTFESPLDPEIGPGDVVVFGGGLLFIRTIDGPTTATLDSPAVKSHTSEAVSIKRAYNSLASWEADRQGNLVVDDHVEVGIARHDGPLSALEIDGSTTDATHTITLLGYDAHNGQLGAGVVLDGESTHCHGITVGDSNVTIDNLELRRFNPDLGCGPAGVVIAASNVLVQNLLVDDYDTAVPNASAAVRLSDAPGSVGIVRNVFALRGKIGMRVPPNTGTSALTVENCTVHSMSSYGFEEGSSGGGFTVTNSIAVMTGQQAYQGVIVQQANISSDASATGMTLVSAASLFVSTAPGTEDLHLLPASAAVDAGGDLSASFQRDIDGELRPRGLGWDIGADEQ